MYVREKQIQRHCRPETSIYDQETLYKHEPKYLAGMNMLGRAFVHMNSCSKHLMKPHSGTITEKWIEGLSELQNRLRKTQR